jgi:hypothetical protein
VEEVLEVVHRLLLQRQRRPLLSLQRLLLRQQMD